MKRSDIEDMSCIVSSVACKVCELMNVGLEHV